MNDDNQTLDPAPEPQGPLAAIIRFSLHNKFFVLAIFGFLMLTGVYFAPFDWRLGGIERDPIAVDAIPDIGEKQQIIFTEWSGRSPQDVENQISYPLTAELMGMPGVKAVRANSMFGFSTVYVIFDDKSDFYWARTRILEKLNSLPPVLLPSGVTPRLGPDATALGQVFWYTIEGQDADGHPTGGWDLDELRSIQDWVVRYQLLGVDGVSEVASIGGFVREYQVDADPNALRKFNVTFRELADAVRAANTDVGARTLELNRAEYLIRSLGYVKSLDDIGNSVIKAVDGVPVLVKHVATVTTGPAPRQGLLDKQGAEAVGGVVTVRYGENPLRVINAVKREIAAAAATMPEKVLADGTVSKLKLVPFYDRSGLIYQTLETLNAAIWEEILITLIVIMIMLRHLRTSLLISLLLPGSVLLSFILMKIFGVDANIVALAGIAIAIGEIADVGIVLCENAVKRLDEAPPGADRLDIVYRSTSEVAGAVLTSILTTIVSFMPVFSLQMAEGKLFRPLAYTKTFTMAASILIAIVILPPLLHLMLSPPGLRRHFGRVVDASLAVGCIVLAIIFKHEFYALPALFPLYGLLREYLPEALDRRVRRLGYLAVAVMVAWFLTRHWMPLGEDVAFWRNFGFVLLLMGFFFGMFQMIDTAWRPTMHLILRHKLLVGALPVLMLCWGFLSWRGAAPVLEKLPAAWRMSAAGQALMRTFPGLGSEFVPALDEGSFLFMPTAMPHAGVEEIADLIARQDRAISAIPEVVSAVGKAGRAETPLDPAPMNMIETIVNYRDQYLTSPDGRRELFRFDPEGNETVKDPEGRDLAAPDGKPYRVRGRFLRDATGRLIPAAGGRVFRLWRPALDPVLNPGRADWRGVNTPDDIWNLIVAAAAVPGITSAPKLQPIQGRIVMLQSGMRAAMGLVIRGPNLESIEHAADLLATELRGRPEIRPDSVVVDRFVGKPYLEIIPNRREIARYGIRMADLQEVLEGAIGGGGVTTTVEDRERYAIRVRFQRELRDSPEALRRLLVESADGIPIPLGQLAEFRIVRGPQEIKSENSFKVGYVFFDRVPAVTEGDAVERVAAAFKAKFEQGQLQLPAGVSYRFAGNYENQLRANQRLAVVIPVSLVLIFGLIYLQFRKFGVSLMIFSSIAIAWAGGFAMLWLYNTPWFLNFDLFGVNMHQLFNVGSVNMSVTVWIGFLALFGVATDDAVIMAVYIEEVFARRKPCSVEEIHHNIVEGSKRRLRPCLMTTATTLFALLPVLTVTG
ncbi:MAG: efflux RND transporter permease subunit, partial [Victivallaceae bacterium]